MKSFLILLVLLGINVQAEDFPGQVVVLGKKKCLCDIKLNMEETCIGTAKCNRKCFGTGQVEVAGCNFLLAVKKGKGKISKCMCDVGSGTASGSGEEPVPLPTVPQPPIGTEIMQCDCSEGTGECRRNYCSFGFTKVCSTMMGYQCPPNMQKVCPVMLPPITGRMKRNEDEVKGSTRSSHPTYCQCMSDSLLYSMIGAAAMPVPGKRSLDREMTKITFKIGKRTCKCQYDINEEECKNSKMSCDKKCSGKMVGLELEDGKYLMNIIVKKGKVNIAKCETKENTGIGGEASSGGVGGLGQNCVCVSMEGGYPPPPGSGTEPSTGGGSSSQEPPTETVLVRLPDAPKGTWWVGLGQIPDTIDFNCSENINLVSISLLGSNTTQRVNGQVVLERGSQILAIKQFEYEASPETGYYDQPFDFPLTLSSKFTYKLKLVYFGNPSPIWSATGGRETISVPARCGDVEFKFSGGSNGGDYSRGQFPRIMFSC